MTKKAKIIAGVAAALAVLGGIAGFIVGRYWIDAGPTKTLYIPAPILNEGENEIIVFELHGCSDNNIFFTDEPDLG